MNHCIAANDAMGQERKRCLLANSVGVAEPHLVQDIEIGSVKPLPAQRRRKGYSAADRDSIGVQPFQSKPYLLKIALLNF
jgi:hypothetical protein